MTDQSIEAARAWLVPSAWSEATSGQRLYLPGLDGLRAFSVLIVIAAHAGLGHIVPGDYGVTVFFFISGFLITTLLTKERKETGKVSVGNFYARRYFRLTPELAFYLIVAVIFSGFVGAVDWDGILSTILYINNYLKAVGLSAADSLFTVEHLWSLSVEEHFYLLFPLAIAVLATKKRNLILSLAALIIIAPLWRWCTMFLEFPAKYTFYATDSRIDSIAFGCLAALLFTKELLSPLRTPLANLALLALAALLTVASFTLGDGAEIALKYSLQGLGLIFAFAALYASRSDSIYFRILELPIFRTLGQLSYGMYIWHFAAINLTVVSLRALGAHHDSTLTSLVVAVIATLASLGAAELSRRYVLGPFNVFRRRFGSHTQ